jgi:hypothetical protein
VIRFGLTFVRQETVLVFGLQEAQLVALVTGTLALAILMARLLMKRGLPSESTAVST